VLPRVQQAVSGATFTICGSRPTAEVEALATLPGVTVTGRVADVRPYLDAAQVAVVPIRIARGIQNKLLEAMAMGLPCVSTTAAWTGIDVSGESGVLLADDEAHFADRVIELLREPALRERCAREAREAVVAHYSWQAQLARLDAVLARAVAEKTPAA
jgi:glycosyltransferase involved in cell wall biosynthesis